MLPIQTAPIDRTNRALRLGSEAGDVAPRMLPSFLEIPPFLPPSCETLCYSLPPQLKPLCKIFCRSIPGPWV